MQPSDKLIWYNQNIIYDHKEFPDVSLWASWIKQLYFNCPIFDRTGKTIAPFNFKILDDVKIPQPSKPLSYEECCLNRAKQIWDRARVNNVPILLLLSGGVDSTTAFVSFLKRFDYHDLDGMLKVVCTTDSIRENPKLFENHIYGKFELISTFDLHRYLQNKALIVTGEMNDHLFGHFGPLKTLVKKYGHAVFKLPYSIDFAIDWFVEQGLEEHEAKHWADIVHSTIDPSLVTTVSDFLWWTVFNFFYQSGVTRFMAYDYKRIPESMRPEFYHKYLNHFFHTDDFQVWSMNNPSLRTNLNQFKQTSKEFIYEFDKDKNYFKTKFKNESLYKVYKIKQPPQGLDENFNPVFNLKPFYLEANSYLKK